MRAAEISIRTDMQLQLQPMLYGASDFIEHGLTIPTSFSDGHCRSAADPETPDRGPSRPSLYSLFRGVPGSLAGSTQTLTNDELPLNPLL
jgi:hypothetical protein